MLSKTTVLLQVLKINVSGENGKIFEANALFDTGSDRTYMTENLVDKISPKWLMSQQVASATFGDKKPGTVLPRNLYSVHMKSNDGDMTMCVTETPTICAPLFRPHVPNSLLESFTYKELNIINYSDIINIDILIGLDNYWNLVSGQCKLLDRGLMAQKTIFGWMLSGTTNSSNSGVQNSNTSLAISHQLLSVDQRDIVATKFWDLEHIGIKPNELDTDNDLISKFENDIKV